ncbi:ABC transporter ATP-binding protein [Dokdonella sp.]|uniref:ATP-binding cassette domain-containing protein n=1 Tax=Dokdonella sp. TaxID=2291710 RepID=UPI0025C57941|nr:ABC transporter ATP-binding protein [Dokdonella sp.]MBX3687797.1 ABC transporter ATP-binding protein [Dokdonella sp.]
MSPPVLEIRGLAAQRRGRRILRDLDLQLDRGHWLVLLGANGSGKSTLLDCCVDRLQPLAGQVQIEGHSLLTTPVAAKQRLGYAIAPERLPELLSARECLAVQAAAKGLSEIDEEVLELAHALGLAPWLDDAVALMSYGTRQKVGALIALLGEPALIVLDETFNGLDPASALVLKRHLRARVDAGRCAVLLATHSLDLAQHWADHVTLLHEGRLLETWTRAQLEASRTAGADLEDLLAARVSMR